jgi:hypothetical protein|tara:strand:+ start:16018 stop:16611 length:594 start_codon:yes stop_codon:yes gene_type:complete
MANPNAPYGLKPLRERGGQPYSGAANTYYVPSTDATALFIGDPVILAGSSGNAQAGPESYPTVTRATAGATNRISGVVVGFQPTPALTPYGYRPASTAMNVLIADDPGLEFVIQVDSTGIADTQVGLNANLTSGSGSTATKQSGFILDGTTPDPDATYQLRILGLEPQINNEFGAYADVLVRLNLPTEAGIASGLGI